MAARGVLLLPTDAAESLPFRESRVLPASREFPGALKFDVVFETWLTLPIARGVSGTAWVVLTAETGSGNHATS